MLKQVLAVLAIFGAAQLVAVTTPADADKAATTPATEVKKEEVVTTPAAADAATTPAADADKKEEKKNEATK